MPRASKTSKVAPSKEETETEQSQPAAPAADETLRFNGVKVFSATMAQERERLGEKVTDWLKTHPSAKIVDKIVTQSSDEAFHCISITLFFWEDLA